jgi:antitoxin ParD1/3/4
MPKLTVELTDPLARFVEEAVARGDYSSADEAVRDALYVLRQEPAVHGGQLAVLRREVRKGLIEADAGQVSAKTIEDILREVESRDDAAA